MPTTSRNRSSSAAATLATAAASPDSATTAAGSYQSLLQRISAGGGGADQQQQQLAAYSSGSSYTSASSGTLKATLPVLSALVLRRGIGGGARNPGGPSTASNRARAALRCSATGNSGNGDVEALSPPSSPPKTDFPLLRHITPSELAVGGGGGGGGGHRSLGCRLNYAAAPYSAIHHHIINSSHTPFANPVHSQIHHHHHPSIRHRSRSSSTVRIRRTVSLDAVYQRPAIVVVISRPKHQHQLLPVLHMLSQAANSSATAGDDSSNSNSGQCAVLYVDKATQTLESYLEHQLQQQQQLDHEPNELPNACDGETSSVAGQQQQQQSTSAASSPSGGIKIDKVLRQRLQQRSVSSGGGGLTVMAVVGTQLGAAACGVEHSVSSQTLSPQHVKAIPMTIPIRPHPTSGRPMRSSVEGLNMEIEKLVLQPDQPHTCRPETSLFARGETPEGHHAPLVDLLHGTGLTGCSAGGVSGIGGSAFVGSGDRRSVNTQTPSREFLSSDESQSTSPDDCASSSGTGASPRINRFLAREPPDGCEKVSLKLTDTDQPTGASGHAHLFKPSGFRLRPSLGSAFQPIIASSRSSQDLPTEAEAEAELETIVRIASDTTANDSDDEVAAAVADSGANQDGGK